MNAIVWNRDITLSVDQIRDSESGMSDKVDRGKNTVSLPEMRKGNIGFCVATQIGHCVSPKSPVQGWRSPEIAWAITQAQLAWYQAMVEKGEMVQLFTKSDLDNHLTQWSTANQEAEEAELIELDEGGNKATKRPIGFILSLEGADSLVTLGHVERAFQYGLRIIGPAHFGPGRYADGTGASGGFTAIGFQLLNEMQRMGMMLDMTHLTDVGFQEALDNFGGRIWASHHNCRSIIDDVRQITDQQIQQVAQRDGLIGLAFDAWMLHNDWVRGKTTPAGLNLTIRDSIEHIDHICQLVGSARHCCIGSDLDGGYGFEQTPQDLNKISDLQKIGELLCDRGYSDHDIDQIMHGNSLRLFRESLPG